MADYVIQKGDTLSQLAAKNGVSVGAIQKANPSITDINKIYAGSTLQIPTALPTVKTNTIQTTTGQRTQDNNAQTKFNEVINEKVNNTATNGTGTSGTGTGTGTETGTKTKTGKDTSVPTEPTIVTSTDNGDGTTTHTMSDGTTKNESTIAVSERAYNTKLNSQLSDLDTQKTQFDQQIDSLMKSNNSLYRSTLGSIKSTFDTRRTALTQSYERLASVREKAGYASDSFRYTPTHAEGLVTNDENEYISGLADLDAQEQSLVLQAQSAKNAKDWDALGKQMTLYDSISTKKSDLLGKLLTVAQAQNNRIEAENKIAREAALIPKSAGAATLAKSISPVLAKEIKSMSQEEAVKYITEKATALNIDADILRSAVIEQGVQNLKDAKSLAEKPASDKLTESEILTNNFAKINKILEGNTSVNGVPITDPSGFFTPQGFKTLVKAARSSGVSRKQFLEEYGGSIDPAQVGTYGLTAAEKKIITGEE